MADLITLNILNQRFTFRADLDPTRVQLVVDYLEQKIESVQEEQNQSSVNLNKLALMIVVALNLAFENIELKQAYSKGCQTLASRMEHIVQRINAPQRVSSNQARCG